MSARVRKIQRHVAEATALAQPHHARRSSFVRADARGRVGVGLGRYRKRPPDVEAPRNAGERTEAQRTVRSPASIPPPPTTALDVRAEIQRVVADPTIPPNRKQAAIQTLQRVLAALEVSR